jgi:hypothetical protein
VARASQGCPATAGSFSATRYALSATTAVICSEDVVASAEAQNGAHPVGSGTGRANGRPPSGSVTASSQSHSSRARPVVATGAASAKASRACSAPPGWLVRERRSGSRPQP